MPSKVRPNVNIDAQLKEDTAAMPFESSDKRYSSIEEVAGENWQEGLDVIEDEWE